MNVKQKNQRLCKHAPDHVLPIQDTIDYKLYLESHEKQSVQIRPSTIPNAGDGCFAMDAIPVGCCLGVYGGSSPVYMCPDAIDDCEYVLSVRHMVLDVTVAISARSSFGIIHWTGKINHSNDPNVLFCDNGRIVALRDITKEEELFVDYGKGYWLWLLFAVDDSDTNNPLLKHMLSMYNENLAGLINCTVADNVAKAQIRQGLDLPPKNASLKDLRTFIAAKQIDISTNIGGSNRRTRDHIYLELKNLCIK